ncbi:hypothetical protein FHT08_000417 [Xanthomonas campestris]|nr:MULTISPECIES: hypothetical protein [Xanthomonas]MBB5734731.1 hypothetical protein [Xanthomonas sp. CFBP 8152]MEB1611569.1 hypothetical protein [Xanthomonas campestris pv. campestris]NIJ75369.1 hypothetical protein [Xanthomonas sp. CFBP 8151]
MNDITDIATIYPTRADHCAGAMPAWPVPSSIPALLGRPAFDAAC